MLLTAWKSYHFKAAWSIKVFSPKLAVFLVKFDVKGFLHFSATLESLSGGANGTFSKQLPDEGDLFVRCVSRFTAELRDR